MFELTNNMGDAISKPMNSSGNKEMSAAKAETLSKGKWSTRNTTEVKLWNEEGFGLLIPGFSGPHH